MSDPVDPRRARFASPRHLSDTRHARRRRRRGPRRRGRPARATATPRPRPAPSVDRTSARASPAPPALIDPLVRLRAPAAFACHARPRTPARHQSPRIDLTHTQHTQLSLTARCPHCHMHMDGMRCAHSSHTDTPRHALFTRLDSLSLHTRACLPRTHTHVRRRGGCTIHVHVPYTQYSPPPPQLSTIASSSSTSAGVTAASALTALLTACCRSFSMLATIPIS